MHRRIGLIALLAATLASVLLAVGPRAASPTLAWQASPMASPVAAREALHFDVQFRDTILAADPSTLAAGDRIILSDRLLRGGREVGHDAGVCTITDPAGEAICEVVYSLPDGTIAAQFINAPPPAKTFAVVGGTGRYAGARGTGTLLEHEDQTGVLDFQLRPEGQA